MRAAIVLKASDRRRASGGPAPTRTLVSSAPSPRSRAAPASVVMGRLSQRARPMATRPAVISPAADTPAISIHKVSTRWSSDSVERDSSTVPMAPMPESGTTGVVATSQSPDQ